MTAEEKLDYVIVNLELVRTQIKELSAEVTNSRAKLEGGLERIESFETSMWKRAGNMELRHVELVNVVIANRAEQDIQASELRRLRSKVDDTAIDDQLLSDIAEEPE